MDRRYDLGRARRIVRGVEVLSCPRCGQMFLDLAAAGFVDRALGLGRGRGRPRRAA